MIRYIFFDFWGTLIVFDGEESVHQMRRERAKRFEKELKNYGYNFSQKRVWEALECIRLECTQIRDTTYKEIGAAEVTAMTLKELGVNPVFTGNGIDSRGIYNRCAEIYSDVLLSMNLTLQDGTAQVLELLKKEGLKIGLLSNTEHGGVERAIIKNFNLQQYFDSMTFSCDVRIRKPSPEIFRYALASLSAQPTESVYIGDWPEIDVLGAKRAGMGAIYLKAGNTPYPEGIPAPDATIEKLTQIPEVLAKAFKNA